MENWRDREEQRLTDARTSHALRRTKIDGPDSDGVPSLDEVRRATDQQSQSERVRSKAPVSSKGGLFKFLKRR